MIHSLGDYHSLLPYIIIEGHQVIDKCTHKDKALLLLMSKSAHRQSYFYRQLLERTKSPAGLEALLE